MSRTRRNALLLFAFGTVLGLLLFSYYYLDDLTRGVVGTLPRRLIEEMTGAYGIALAIPVIARVARRWPFSRRRWLASSGPHLAAACLISAALTTLNWASRSAIFRLAGLGTYDYGIMRIRYFMELPNDVLAYAMVVGFVTLFDRYRAARDHEVRAAHLESALAQAQLRNLRLQLQPHFLFNALNTIAATMYESVPAADAMLGRLAELLRHTLRAPAAQEATVAEEMRALELYLDIMRARMEDRLAVRVTVEPGTEDALLPPLLLQPLVENAIRHGTDPATARADVEVRCARENGSLLLEVRDHGPGLGRSAADALRAGIGLSTTADRLRGLYGDASRLEIRDAGDGGVEVCIAIPYHAPA